MTFDEFTARRARRPAAITDAYCLRLLGAMRRHDFDARTLAEREKVPA